MFGKSRSGSLSSTRSFSLSKYDIDQAFTEGTMTDPRRKTTKKTKPR